MSKNNADDELRTRSILSTMIKNNLYINPKKCTFQVNEIDFMGYLVTSKGLKMHPEKTSAVTSWPIPDNSTQLYSFLMFANYYRRFIRNFSQVTKKLHECCSKKVIFKDVFDEECVKPFKKLQQLFTSDPILKPYDFEKRAILETDASGFAMGGVLKQEIKELNILLPFFLSHLYRLN